MSRASATAASRLRAEVTNYINTQPLTPASLHRRRTDRPVPATGDRRLSTVNPVRLRAVTPAHLTSSAARPAAYPSGPGPRVPSISDQDPLRPRQQAPPCPLTIAPPALQTMAHCQATNTALTQTQSSPDRSSGDRKQGQAGTADASLTSTIASIATALAVPL